MIVKARRFVPAFILFAVTVSTLSADIFSELDENIDTPRFSSLLMDAMKNSATIDDVDRLVRDYLPRLPDDNLRLQLLFQAGSRYELAHRYDRAKRLYLQTRQIAPSDTEVALRLAGVLLEEGAADEAIIVLSNAIHTAESRTLQRRTAFLRSRAYHQNGNIDQAIIHLRSLTAVDHPYSDSHRQTVEVESFALLAELALLTDQDTLYGEVSSRMKSLFPDSPETMLLEDIDSGRITYYPSPARIAAGAGPVMQHTIRVEEANDAIRDERVVANDQADETSREDSDTLSQEMERPRAEGIQTGSFRDRENAEYMALDIEDFGFRTEVREVRIDGNLFYRVIVPLSGEAVDPQNLVVALKERGVEGFLVFD